MMLLLAGFMGAGKSTVGKLAGRNMGLLFVDLDREIEKRAGMSVRSVFERHGEKAFRMVESETLRRVLTRRNVVVALGGGVLGRSVNRKRIERCGEHVIYLHGGFSVLSSRIKRGSQGSRPVWARRGVGRQRLLFNNRAEVYRGMADETVVVNGKTARAVAQEVVQIVSGRRADDCAGEATKGRLFDTDCPRSVGVASLSGVSQVGSARSSDEQKGL